jgi:transposase
MIAPKKRREFLLKSVAIMKKKYIDENAWCKILTFLRSVRGIHTRDERLLKNFVEAVWWMASAGAQWRKLESTYGNWNSIFKRFDRWSKKGIWNKLLNFCIQDPDMEYIMIDATIVRAHACAAGYGKQDEQGLGRSRGGFSSKIHAKVDALGNPLEFIITAGQRAEVKFADQLLDDVFDAHVLGDRAFDANSVRQTIKNNNCVAVIPPRSNRLEPAYYDEHIYKERHAIECFFGKIKHFRRIFSRYDKSMLNFVSFLSFVGALIWLR